MEVLVEVKGGFCNVLVSKRLVYGKFGPLKMVRSRKLVETVEYSCVNRRLG